jgi:hypothetical protein
MAQNINKSIGLCTEFMADRYFSKKLLLILNWHYNLPKMLTRTLKSVGYFQVKKDNFQKNGKIH